jgi:hypothetical protein
MDSMLLYFATVKRTTIHTAIARIHAYHAYTHTHIHTHTHKTCLHTLRIQIHTYTHTHTIVPHAHGHTGHTRMTTHFHRCFIQRMSLELFCPECLHSLASSPLCTVTTTTTDFTTTGGAVKHIPRSARRGSWTPWGRMEVRREWGGGGSILTCIES